jgi:5-methylcytosine-specific restriction enzyme subunit McrC
VNTAANQLRAARRFVTLTENCANPISALGITPHELPTVARTLSQAGFARGAVYNRRGEPAIQTVSKVGVIQIGGASGWQVEVVPKFGKLETFSMLQGLWALGSNFDDTDHADDPPLVATESLHDFFVSWSLSRIVRFLDRTLRREYVRRAETLHGQIKGRIDASAWPKSWARGRPFEIPCEHFVFDLDTQANRILRAGLEAIARYLARFCPEDQRRALSCRSALARLGAVRSVEVCAEEVRGLRYDSLTRHYQPLHEICALLLDGLGLGHHGDVEGVAFLSFGFDLARAFQTLLLLVLRRVSADHVRSEPRFYYDWQGGNASAGPHRPHLKPDYLLTARGEVLDAKYKDVLVDVGGDPLADDDAGDVSVPGQRLRIDRADVYQAIAYTAHQELRARRVTFVFPVCSGDPGAYPASFPLRGFQTGSLVRIGVVHLGGPTLSIVDRVKLWEDQVRGLLAD